MHNPTMAIIVGGGPAPGINGVIGSAAIEAINNGLSVIGIYDGFSRLVGQQFDPRKDIVDLTIENMSRIHFDGGSVLRTARPLLIFLLLLASLLLAVSLAGPLAPFLYPLM